MAIVCALVLGGTATADDTRPVAIIVLSDEAAARQLGKDVGNALYGHRALRPLADPDMVSELLGGFDDENLNQWKTAEDYRARAERWLSQFSFTTAASDAEAGQEALHGATPNTQVVALYADLAFAYATAKLGESRAREAAEAFALVHRLSPDRKLDAARYLPEVVQAFDAARATVEPREHLAVQGTGRVWIDGREAGAAPGTFVVTAGIHVVWLTGPARETVGKKVVVEPGQERTVELPDAPASLALRVMRARLALKFAPDPAARAVAMRRLAELLDVHDAVLIVASGGKLIAQTWHDKAEGSLLPGFSAHRIVEPDKVSELLRPLTPPAKPEVEKPLPEVVPPIEKPRWYARTSVRTGIVVGVIAAVVGSILVARSLDDGWIGVHHDPGFRPGAGAIAK